MIFCGIFIRKSRKDKDNESHRLTVQREKLPAYAVSQGWKYEVYDDGHASAARGKTEDLKERARLEADIRAGKINIILCIELSRLSRDESLQDFVAWLHLCAEHGVKLATMSRTLDPSQHSDWMLLLMEGGFSSVEMKVLKGRMKEGYDQAFRAGKYLGGTPPPPYVYDHAAERPVIDPEKLKQMQTIWKLAETQSARAIAEKLNLPEISIRRALSDDRLNFYQAKRVNGSTLEVIQCDWQPCMTAEQALLVRAGRRSRKNLHGSKAAYASLLSAMGLIYCGHCGATMKTWQGNQRAGTRIDYYGCQKKSGTSCPSRMFQQRDINEIVITNLLHTLGNLEELKNYWVQAEKAADPNKQLADLSQQIRMLEQKKQRLISAISEGIIELQDAKGQMQKISDSVNDLKGKQQQILQSMQTAPDWSALAINEEEYFSMTTAEQRELLKLAIERIDFYDTYAIITYPFPRSASGNRTSRVRLPSPKK